MEEDTKPWWQSHTIWASVLQVGLGIAVTFGVLSDAQGNALLADGPDILVGLATALLGGWGLYGRVRATKTVTAV